MKQIYAAVFMAVFVVTLALSPLHAADREEAPEKDMTPWLWANFLILTAGLGYLAVKKGGPFFVSRSEDIRKGIAESEQRKTEAEARAAAVHAKMANLDKEIASIRTSIRDEQAQESARIQRETAAELERIAERGAQEIEAASKAARLELRRHAAHLSLELAEQKLRQRMTPAIQGELIRSFVQDLREPPALTPPATQ